MTSCFFFGALIFLVTLVHAREAYQTGCELVSKVRSGDAYLVLRQDFRDAATDKANIVPGTKLELVVVEHMLVGPTDLGTESEKRLFIPDGMDDVSAYSKRVTLHRYPPVTMEGFQKERISCNKKLTTSWYFRLGRWYSEKGKDIRLAMKFVLIVLGLISAMLLGVVTPDEQQSEKTENIENIVPQGPGHYTLYVGQPGSKVLKTVEFGVGGNESPNSCLSIVKDVSAGQQDWATKTSSSKLLGTVKNGCNSYLELHVRSAKDIQGGGTQADNNID